MSKFPFDDPEQLHHHLWNHGVTKRLYRLTSPLRERKGKTR